MGGIVPPARTSCVEGQSKAAMFDLTPRLYASGTPEFRDARGRRKRIR
jgi:hypothetical protein